MRAEIGASRHALADRLLRAAGPGLRRSTSRAPAILRSSQHQAAAQKFLAFLVSQQGQEIIAHSISFEYPIASGVTTAQPETPFDELQPNPIDVAELGTGSQAIALLQAAT